MTSSYNIPEAPFVDHLLDLVESDKWGELQLEGMEHTARELDRDGAHAAGAKASSLWTLPPTQELVTCAAPFPIRLISVYNWTGVDFQLTFDGGEQVTVRAGKTFPFVPPHGTQRVRVQSVATGTGFFGLWAFRKLPEAPFPGFDIGSGIVATQPVTVADGADVALGTTTDGIWTGLGAGTLLARVGAIWTRLRGGQQTSANSLPVTIASDQATFPVTVTFPATQPVSAMDGALTTTGALADAAYVSGSGSVVSVLKGIFGRLANVVSLAFNAAGALIVDSRAAANQSTTQVAVGSVTPTQLLAARSTRQSVAIKNLDATNTFYLGAAAVTTGTGFPLKPGESIGLQNTTAIYALGLAGNPTAAIFEEYS